MDKGPREYVLITNPEECDKAFEAATQGYQFDKPIELKDNVGVTREVKLGLLDTPTKEYTVEPSHSRLKSIPAAIRVLSDDGSTVEPIHVNRMAVVLEISPNCHLLDPDGNLVEPITRVE